ncbi:MAG: amidohydrolase, partial [Prolixibacteraceae bacterium]
MNFRQLAFNFLILLISMNVCETKKKADLMVTNATVYTVDENFSEVESFVVIDGKIAATGTTEEILQKYEAEKIINGEGKFIYPGFNDAHAHFNGYGTNLTQYADLRGTENPEEVYAILEKHYQQFGGDWILGRSWDQNDWEIQEFPDKSKLDELFPNTPVYLVRIDGHAAWCNSKALELAGITSGTKISGGQVVVKNGEPTGILIDNTMGLVSELIPEITREQQKLGLLEAQKNCFAAGLTSVTDAGIDKSTILLMEEMQNDGSLKMRINAMLNPTDENFELFVNAGPQKTDRLVVNTIKIFADGALGSRGALLIDDYSDDPGNKGIQIEAQDYYDNICQLAYDNNYAVAAHCIGDGANRLMLDTYAKFLQGKND